MPTPNDSPVPAPPVGVISEEMAFDALLREGIIRIGQRTSWMPILSRVRLVQWPEFIVAMRATEAAHRAFRFRGV